MSQTGGTSKSDGESIHVRWVCVVIVYIRAADPLARCYVSHCIRSTGRHFVSSVGRHATIERTLLEFHRELSTRELSRLLCSGITGELEAIEISVWMSKLALRYDARMVASAC